MSKPIDSIRTFIKGTSPYPELTAEPLSERELEVLQWLTSGASNQEIGRRLYIAESTVKRHVLQHLRQAERTQPDSGRPGL